MKKIFLLFAILYAVCGRAQQTDSAVLFIPDRVFDGEQMHKGWIVIMYNGKIQYAGARMPSKDSLRNMQVRRMKGMTLLPGLIEGHSHLFLHPYNERSWDDQVLKESQDYRRLQAIAHAKATLLAGFTTVRDLGTEGAMYDDVWLKKEIAQENAQGPRMIVATRAIVLRGSYGPKSEDSTIKLPQAAAEISTPEEMHDEALMEIENGADLIKVYADYRVKKNGPAVPTLTQEMLDAAVETATTHYLRVAAHATTPEGMRRAIMAGVATIEHGDNGTVEIFKLMKEKNVALCPTLAAGDAVEQYRGWKKGKDPEPQRVINKRKTFALALQAGVTICMGGDVGVFAHGDNAREMEMMVDYGMKPIDVLRSATSVNADVFGYADKIGRIKSGLYADLIAVQGDPSINIKMIRKLKWIIKGGVVQMENGKAYNFERHW